MQPNDQLMKFTMAAKAVLANPDRLEQFIKMAQTKPGAITAVHTVLQAIQLRTKIPPEVLPTLSMNIYMLIVDAARQVLGIKPDPNVMRSVVLDLVKSVSGAPQGQPQQSQPQQPQPAPQRGLIASAGA